METETMSNQQKAAQELVAFSQRLSPACRRAIAAHENLLAAQQEMIAAKSELDQAVQSDPYRDDRQVMPLQHEGYLIDYGNSGLVIRRLASLADLIAVPTDGRSD